MSEDLPEPPKPLPPLNANLPTCKFVKINRITGKDLAAKDMGKTSDPFLRIGYFFLVLNCANGQNSCESGSSQRPQIRQAWTRLHRGNSCL
jgi:hypothetical protein